MEISGKKEERLILDNHRTKLVGCTTCIETQMVIEHQTQLIDTLLRHNDWLLKQIYGIPEIKGNITHLKIVR